MQLVLLQGSFSKDLYILKKWYVMVRYKGQRDIANYCYKWMLETLGGHQRFGPWNM